MEYLNYYYSFKFVRIVNNSSIQQLIISHKYLIYQPANDVSTYNCGYIDNTSPAKIKINIILILKI